jgi:hypothetical protein
MIQRLKRRPDRLLALARRARQFADGQNDLVGDLYREHAAICESKAAAQNGQSRTAKQPALGKNLK